MEPSVAFQSSSEAALPSLPAPPWRIVLFGMVALAAGVGLAQLATRTHVREFPGILTARVTPVTVNQAGVIEEWLVNEGDTVRRGQPLAAIADPSVDRRRQNLDAEIVRLEGELEQSFAKAELDLDWRMKDVNQTIFTARLQSAEYLEEKHLHEMEKVALTDLLAHNSTAFLNQPNTVIDSLVLKDKVAENGRLHTVLRLEAAVNATEVCAAQVDLCDDQVEWLEELKESLPVRVRKSTGVDMAERHLEVAMAERDDLEDAESRMVIVSTAIGRAGLFVKRVGDYAAIGDALVEVLDDSQRFVVIEVPSEQLGEFTVGRELTVMFPGRVKRTGRVVRIAPQATQRDATAASSVVRIHIGQAGIIWPSTPIGARVDACL